MLHTDPRVYWGLFLLLLGCAPESNVYTAMTPKDQWQAYDAQISLGQAYYDNGNFEKALFHAEKAYALNDSEQSAVLLGYAYLANAGITPFTLVEKLNVAGTESSGEEEEEVDDSSQSQEDSGSDDSLSLLNDIIGLSPDEFSLMGTVNYDIPELPIIEPSCAGKARSVVRKLELVNKAVSVICKFVDAQILLAEDRRHRCNSSEVGRQHRAESHFLWAFAHLIEALIFNSVLTYNTTGTSKSNLELRVNEIQDIKIESPQDITELVNSIDNLANTVDAVLQVTGFCSEEFPQTQLLAMVNDLISVSFAFSRMPGIPEGMTDTINSSIEKIRVVKESSQGAAGTKEQAEAAKGDLTKSMSEVVGKALDQVKKSDLPSGQVDEICGSYDRISGSQAKGKKPSLCQ